MVGVDHTSGTDTKVETDKPQAPDDTYQPPPDRPGSPGQASRLESKAAAQPPTETDDEPRDDDPPTDESGTGTELQAEDLSEDAEETDAPATTEPPARDRYLDPNDDPNRVGTPRADSWARAAERSLESADRRETNAADGEPSNADQDSDRTEPEQPTEWPDVPLGPRAESRARAREAQQEALAPDTEQAETPDEPGTQTERPETDTQPSANTDQPTGEDTADRPDPEDEQTTGRDIPAQGQSAEPPTADREPQLRDDAETEPGLAEAEDGKPDTERPDDRTHDASEDDEDIPDPAHEPDDTEHLPINRDDSQPLPDGTERNNETPDGTDDGDDSRGSYSEDQPESPPPEENETDQFAGLPTRADLDPATAGELTAERGEPLAPVNENQDLREPDPENDSDWKKMIRSMNNDVEDAVRTGNSLGDDAFNIAEHRPPTDYPTGTRANNTHTRDVDSSPNIPSTAIGLVAAAMVAFSVVEGVRAAGRRFFRRNNDSDR